MREHMRTVRFQPYRKGMGPTFTLQMFDCGPNWNQPGRQNVGYKLTMRENDRTTTLFEGSDFSPSPFDSIDGDDTVKALMGFLTLRPGDTDAEYFENYTNTQLDFCNQHAEALAMAVMDRFGE